MANGCLPLVNDSILFTAAAYHANYMTINKTLSHYEKNSATKTPQLRAEYFNAKHYYVGENVLNTKINAIIKSTDNEQYNTHYYGGLAHNIVMGWVHSPGHFKNIIECDYQITGVSIQLNKENGHVYACQKFARVDYKFHFSESRQLFPYSSYTPSIPLSTFPDTNRQLLNHTHTWELKHNHIETCSDCEKWVQKAPVTTVRIENNSFILKIENSEYVKQIIQEKKDGFAIEIVQYNDYACGNPEYFTLPSRRNGQCRLNGIVLEPLYRDDLIKGFKGRKKKEDFSFLSYLFNADSVDFLDRFPRSKIEKYDSKYFEIKLGKVPKNLSGLWGYNLVYIQNQQICHVDYFTNYCGEVYEEYLSIEPHFPSLNASYSFTPETKTKHFEIYFDQKETDINQKLQEQLFDSLTGIAYTFDSVFVKAFASVEGDSMLNKKLSQERAQTVIEILESKQDSTFNMRVELVSGWNHFYKQIQYHPQWNFLMNYEQQEVATIINQKYADELEPILARERKAQIEITYTIDVTNENLEYYILREQKLWLDSLNSITDPKSPTFLSALNNYFSFYVFTCQKVVTGFVDTNILSSFTMPDEFGCHSPLGQLYLLNGYQFPEHFRSQLEWENFERSKVSLYFKDYKSSLYPEFINHYSNVYIDDWIKNKGASKNKIKNLYSLLQDSKQSLNQNSTNKTNASILLYNLNLLLLNEFFSSDPIKYQNEANIAIVNLIRLQEELGIYNDSLTLTMAKTAVYFNQIDLAIQLLSGASQNDEILSYLLPLYYQHNPFDTQNDFYTLVSDASKVMDTTKWCNLFLHPCGIPFQALDNEGLRAIFCRECLDKNELMKEIYGH